jgi:hypothetical protein
VGALQGRETCGKEPALSGTDDGMMKGAVAAVTAAVLFFGNSLREIRLIGPILEQFPRHILL